MTHLNLGQYVSHLWSQGPCSSGEVRRPEVGRLALKNSRIITVGRHGKVGCLLVGISDHLKQALVLFNTVNRPAGIEYFVTAMSSRWVKRERLSSALEVFVDGV